MNVSIPLEQAKLLPGWSLVTHVTRELLAAGMPPETTHAIIKILSLLHDEYPLYKDFLRAVKENKKVHLSADSRSHPLLVTAAVSIAPHKEDLIRSLALLF